jgi:hypothetical protein
MRTLSHLFSTGASRDFGTVLEKEGSLAAPQNLEPKMNARKEIRDHLIAQRMQHWLQIVRTAILNLRCPTWRARKNFWALVRKYPALAARLGLSEVSVFSLRDEPIPEPLHSDKRPEAQQQPPAKVLNPAYTSPATTRGFSRPWPLLLWS